MRSLFTKPQAPVTSDAVIFNYQQPARARLVARMGMAAGNL